jgi:hypothetical protein
MKKISILLIALILSVTMSFNIFTVSAETVDDTPDFSDNFDSYSTEGYIEDDTSFAENWENEKILYNGGDALAANDAECTGKAKIIDDPTSGAVSGNKVLFIDTKTDNSSFFYVGVKNLRLKEFEMTYKVYVEDANGWFGTAVRKTTNVRFNGTSNMMLTYQVNQTGQTFAYIPYRNYGASGAPLIQTENMTTYDETTGSNLNFAKCEPFENLFYNNWITVKTSVKFNSETNKTDYKTELTDKNGVVYDLGTLPYKSTSTEIYGYVSFVSCVNKAYYDDVQITNLDTVAAPPLEEETNDTDITNISFNKTILSLTTGMSETLVATVYPTNSINKTLSWSSSDTAVAIVDSNGKVTAISSGSANITAASSDGKVSKTCVVTVTAASDSKKGCNSSNTYGLIATIIISLGAILLIKRK